MSKKVLIPLVVLVFFTLGLLARLFWFAQPFTYAGSLETTNVDLSSRVPSAITNVNVHEGDRVKADQDLVDLDCGDLRIADRLAEENYQRGVRLYQVHSIPKETYDEFVNRKQDADLRLAWCTIKSPISGTVLARYHEPAEWVNPGTRILTVANVKDIWAYIYVPETMLAKLSLGQKVTGRLPELNNKAFTGKIVWISDQAEFTPKNVQTRAERTRLVFAVKVSFDNPDEILKPGMYIEVTLPEKG